MPIDHAVFLDGDDTLWKIQETYDEIKKQFSALLQSIGISDKGIVAKLDVLDMQRVVIRGFTIQRFIESLLILYAQLSAENGLPYNIEVEKKIHDIGSLLLRPPKLYEDTLIALDALKDQTQLYLYSSGDKKIQINKVKQLDIEGYFKEIIVVPAKDEKALRRVIAKIGLSPKQIWMVGNSIRSDILPAINIGVRSILVLHGGWKYDAEIHAKEQNHNYHSVKNLREASKIIISQLNKENMPWQMI
jgi:putative hydrolase of the HAD superfamily